MSSGCAWRLFPGALTDFVAEIGHLVGDVSPRFFSASRCDQHAYSYADANSEQENTDFAEYVGIFFAPKSICGSTDAAGRGVIRIPDPVLDVIDIVRQTLSKGINQVKSCTEQYTKKWFSFSKSHICVSLQ
jgi:hypothetical protein